MNISSCLTGWIFQAALSVYLGLIATLISCPITAQADDTNLVQQARTAIANAGDSTKASLQNAGAEAKAGLNDLKERVEASRPDHYSTGEILSLVFIGIVVGAVAGMFTSFKAPILGSLIRLLIGLAGALIGGFILRVTGLKLGLGTLTINYDEVVFAFAGAVLLLLTGRLFGMKRKKRIP